MLGTQWGLAFQQNHWLTNTLRQERNCRLSLEERARLDFGVCLYFVNVFMCLGLSTLYTHVQLFKFELHSHLLWASWPTHPPAHIPTLLMRTTRPTPISSSSSSNTFYHCNDCYIIVTISSSFQCCHCSPYGHHSHLYNYRYSRFIIATTTTTSAAIVIVIPFHRHHPSIFQLVSRGWWLILV